MREPAPGGERPDPGGRYVRRYVEELQTVPDEARRRALERYRV